MPFWTPQEDNILINMVNDNKEVNDIIPVLNKRRDQVAGRIRRLRASGALPPTTAKVAESTTNRRATKPKQRKLPVLPLETIHYFHPLEKLGHNDCRWPIGDPRDKDSFRFCAEPVQRGSPYCHIHAVKAFTSGRVRDEVLESAD